VALVERGPLGQGDKMQGSERLNSQGGAAVLRTSRAQRSTAGPGDDLGRPFRDLRISVTDRCNFRCVETRLRARFGDAWC
jgi:hypothetical protein